MTNPTCPHCGKPLALSDMLYIEVCWAHQYAYDVFHGVQVEWGWFADSTPDDWYDEDDPDDGWTDDEEEDLIHAGICPECGGELDVCWHGADWFDEGDDDE